MELRVAELATELSARIEGDAELVVRSLQPLHLAGPDSISFFSNRRYKRDYLATRAGAVLVGPKELELGRPPASTLLVVADSYLAFAKVATRFHEPLRPAPGIHPQAVVEPGAIVDPTASILALAYVGAGAKIGARAVLHPGCAVLEGAEIGEDSLLWPGVVVRERCVLGARTICQPGAVIGGDGFGFAFDPDGPDGMRHLKIPQAGAVRLEEDVEIGANSCVDRGALGDTAVGKGAKLDNLVQIAHNVEVGPLSLIAGSTAIAGSTKLGIGVVCGGQVGIIGHLQIGDGARFAARSAVSSDVAAGATMGGWPAVDHKDWLREQAAMRYLPDMVRELRDLRRRVTELEARLEDKEG